jgi:hypothetical protein
MAQQHKVLGQVNPLSATYTTLYTVPTIPITQTVCSTLAICNIGTTTTYSIAVRPLGVALSAQHFIVYNSFVNQYDTAFLTLGLSLSASDAVTIYAGTTGLSFSLFGVEIT